MVDRVDVWEEVCVIAMSLSLGLESANRIWIVQWCKGLELFLKKLAQGAEKEGSFLKGFNDEWLPVQYLYRSGGWPVDGLKDRQIPPSSDMSQMRGDCGDTNTGNKLPSGASAR